MARYDPKISLGNIIQIGVVLVAVIMAWANLDNRVKNNADHIDELKSRTGSESVVVKSALTSVREKTRSVELTQTRNSVVLDNIFTVVQENKAALKALDARMDEMERPL